MNNLEKIFLESVGLEDYAKGYFDYVAGLLKQVDLKALKGFLRELEEARRNNNTVFVAGNGGSAATSAHMANDIALDVFKKGAGGKPFRIISLADNIPALTAISNDDGYENIFLMQLKIHFQPQDKLIVISASGNSQNLIQAAEWVKASGGRVIGLLGFDGGRLKDICDVAIHISTPKGEYGPVEDIHLILGHLVSTYLLYTNLKEKKAKKK